MSDVERSYDNASEDGNILNEILVKEQEIEANEQDSSHGSDEETLEQCTSSYIPNKSAVFEPMPHVPTQPSHEFAPIPAHEIRGVLPSLPDGEP